MATARLPLPVPAQKLPTGQALHAVSPLANVPGAQAEHAAAPARLAAPLAHGRHAALLPCAVSALKLLAGQAVQPALALPYQPAGQAPKAQTAAPGALEKPTPHATHADAAPCPPSALDVLAGQAFCVAEQEPAGHQCPGAHCPSQPAAVRTLLGSP